MSTKRTGHCRLCGSYGELTFEHIPPKKAFNNHQRIFMTMQNIEDKRNTRFRKGLGDYSLCEKCNNLTGGWYGEAFVNWTRQGFEYFDKVQGEKMITLPYYIRPLNVLKQTLVMALAMSAETSLNAHRELRQLVLSPRLRYMPPKYRVFMYYNMEGQARFNAGMAIMDTEKGGSDFIMAEVALPPFGYCVVKPVGNSPSIAERKGLHEITWFSRFGYNEFTTVHLRIPTRETNFPSPLDYRNKHGVEDF